MRARGRAATMAARHRGSRIASSPLINYVTWGARIDGSWYRNAAPSGYYTAQVNPDTGATYAVTAPDASDAPWSGPVAGDGWDLFEAHAGKRLTAVQFGNSGSLSDTYFASVAQFCRDRGAFPAYDLSVANQEVIDLANRDNSRGALTAADTHASQIKQSGIPVQVRPMAEMNGDWHNPAWGWQVSQGVSAAMYVEAWVTLWLIFRARMTGTPLDLTSGTDTGNAAFCWCVTRVGPTVPDPAPWWPGSQYVDRIGLDCYGYGNESVDAVFQATYDAVAGLDVSLPMVIGETGVGYYVGWSSSSQTPSTVSTTPTKAQFITDLFAWLKDHPRIKHFNWFNEAGNPQDPHIEFGEDALLAFRAGIADERFLANVAGGWALGTKPLVP